MRARTAMTIAFAAALLSSGCQSELNEGRASARMAPPTSQVPSPTTAATPSTTTVPPVPAAPSLARPDPRPSAADGAGPAGRAVRGEFTSSASVPTNSGGIAVVLHRTYEDRGGAHGNGSALP